MGILRIIALNFSQTEIVLVHANIRISVRKMRERERNHCSFGGLERVRMSSLRLKKAFEEIFHIRFRRRQQLGGSQPFRGRT